MGLEISRSQIGIIGWLSGTNSQIPSPKNRISLIYINLVDRDAWFNHLRQFHLDCLEVQIWRNNSFGPISHPVFGCFDLFCDCFLDFRSPPFGFDWKCWVNIPNEIAIFHRDIYRDHDQQNHWVQGYTTFSDTPIYIYDICIYIYYMIYIYIWYIYIYEWLPDG